MRFGSRDQIDLPLADQENQEDELGAGVLALRLESTSVYFKRM
jgi:hypothetical protein